MLYRLYQVISRNAIEQIERTHGFDRKRMKWERKKWEKRCSSCDRIDRVDGPPSSKTKTHEHTNKPPSHNYGWKQLLFAWPLCAPARLSTRSLRSPARMHACTANSSSDTPRQSTPNNSIALRCVHTNINIIIKLDAHHKFQSTRTEQLGHLYSHYRPDIDLWSSW